MVLATGVTWRRLGVPSLEALVGAGVFYGAAASEAKAMRDEPVFVVGGGNSAGQAAVHLARYAAQVTLLARRASLSETMSDYLVGELQATPNITVRYHTEAVAGHGDGHLTALTLEARSWGATESVPATALFVLIGTSPTPAGRWTARRCCWKRACRGCSPPLDQAVASAVGEGAVAVAQIHQHLQATPAPSATIGATS